MSGGKVTVKSMIQDLNVSYWAKVWSKTKIFLPEANITIKIWMKIDEVDQNK